MRVCLSKSEKESSTILIPSSKSLSHRYLIAASLCKETSIIRRLADNQDIQATKACLEKRGACFNEKGDTTYVTGVEGFDHYDGSLLDSKESGSTLRFLLPLFAQSGKQVSFRGQGELLKRPLTVYEELYDIRHDQSQILVQGKLEPGTYPIKGNISSQFISGLLLLLPLLKDDSSLIIQEPFESKSYVLLTIDVLKKAGIDVCLDKNTIFIKGNQSYSPFDVRVSGDDSQAVFFAVLSLLAQKTIEVQGLDHNSRQGDHIFLKYLSDAGCLIHQTKDGYRFQEGKLQSFNADLQDCPDLGPALFVLASACPGTSVFTHTDRLRLKESDRISCMKEELNKLNVEFTQQDDTVFITGRKLVGDVVFDCHNDHRIAMALSVLSAAIDGKVCIEHGQAVKKSYPSFYEDLNKTGIEVKYYD